MVHRLSLSVCCFFFFPRGSPFINCYFSSNANNCSGAGISFKHRHKSAIFSTNWRGELCALYSLILHRHKAKGYFLKRLSDVPQMTSCVSVHGCPLHSVCVSRDHFRSRQEKTTSVIAGIIGKHRSPGCACLSCHVRTLQSHIIPMMALCEPFVSQSLC